MIQYVLRRLLTLPIIIFLVTAILFSLLWQLPVEVRASVYVPQTDKFLTPEEQAEIKEKAEAESKREAELKKLERMSMNEYDQNWRAKNKDKFDNI